MMGSGWLWLAFDQLGRVVIVGTYGPGTIVATRGQDRRYVRLRELVGEDVLDVDAAGGARGPGGRSGPTIDFSAAYTDTMGASLTGSEKEMKKEFTPERGWRPSGGAGAGQSADVLSTADELFPLMCLSVHERAYMREYGLFGKGAYVDAMWGSFDWSNADSHYLRVLDHLFPSSGR